MESSNAFDKTFNEISNQNHSETHSVTHYTKDHATRNNYNNSSREDSADITRYNPHDGFGIFEAHFIQQGKYIPLGNNIKTFKKDLR